MNTARFDNVKIKGNPLELAEQGYYCLDRDVYRSIMNILNKPELTEGDNERLRKLDEIHRSIWTCIERLYKERKKR